MPKKILIADDNKEEVDYLIEAIQNKGHEVMYVNCGNKAKEALEQESLDAAIFDGEMPVEEGGPIPKFPYGITLVRIARDTCPGMPIAIHSTYLSSSFIEILEHLNIPYFRKHAKDSEGVIKYIESARKE